ncbi:hypothetical protein GQ44DRAFT_776033 [Phaeosphaeriaceae sp. PMI808]|nr:hypothetical protein GQ44DRAFT_776033 [Phaeosphaeriaceae sp. PMI808]
MSIHDEQAMAIVKETGGLTLAVRHIGSYLCAMNVDPKEFLQEYRDEDEASAIDAWGESSPSWYSHTLSTFLNYAFGQLTGDPVALFAVVVFLDWGQGLKRDPIINVLLVQPTRILAGKKNAAFRGARPKT